MKFRSFRANLTEEMLNNKTDLIDLSGKSMLYYSADEILGKIMPYEKYVVIYDDVLNVEDIMEIKDYLGTRDIYLYQDYPKLIGFCNDGDMIIEILSHHGLYLEYILDQNDQYILAAVTNNGMALKHAKHQTPEICMAAVESNGLALQFVVEKTDPIIRAALTNDGNAIKFISSNKIEYYELAASNGGFESCRFKLKSLYTGSEIRHDLLDEYQYEIVDGEIVLNEHEIPDIEKYYDLIKVSDLSVFGAKFAEDGMLLRLLKRQTPELILQAVTQNGMAIKYAFVQNEQIALAAVRQNGLALEFVINKVQSVVNAAIDQNPLALAFVPNIGNGYIEFVTESLQLYR